MKGWAKLLFVSFVILILLGFFIWNKLFNPNLYAASSLLEIVEYWSPVIYQSTERRDDYITNFDFDNNYIGADNWENLYCYPLPAYVYYSIIESTNFYFINYNFFHPRDPGNPAFGNAYAHENDFEGCRFVIVKDGSQWGRLGCIETIAHYSKYNYDRYDLKFEDPHPIVYVCPYKHAVYGKNWAHQQWDCYYLGPDCRIFPSKKSGTGVIYRYKGIAEEPQDMNDRDVSYDLIDLKDTIWARRFDRNTMEDCGKFIKNTIKLSSDPNSCGYLIQYAKFGEKFEGDNGQLNAATPPWNYHFDSGGIWFIEPLLGWFVPDGRSLKCAGEKYIYNPYLNSSSGCPPEPDIFIMFGLDTLKKVDKNNINPGDSVTYTYLIKNVGIYPAKNICIKDNKLGNIGNKSILDPNQTWTIQKTTTLNQTTTNQATVTCSGYVQCEEYYRTYFSNKVTVEVGYTPPPEPPEKPEPPKPPGPISPAAVVWYWDDNHSFTENKHSLSNWLNAKTADAYINEKGYIEINIDPLEYPNVISSPDLGSLIPGKRFDAIKILYSNLVEYSKWPSEGAIGWLDETLVDEKKHLRRLEEIGKSGEFMVKFPLEYNPKFKWSLIVLKNNPNWETEAQTLGLTLVPSCNDRFARGKFLIRAIKLMKIN